MQHHGSLQAPAEGGADNDSQEAGGLASMFSPRNILKFINKNIQELASPRLHSLMGLAEGHAVRTASPFTPDEISKQFGPYISAIAQVMAQYKATQARAATMLTINHQKQAQREQIETDIRLNKIPKHYFEYLSEDQSDRGTMSGHHQAQVVSGHQAQAGSSLKLHYLLMTEEHEPDTRRKSRPKPKKVPLARRQEQLEEYLDQVELVIYSKAQKYPHRTIDHLVNLEDSGLSVGRLISQAATVRQIILNKKQLVLGRYRRVIVVSRVKANMEKVLSLMKSMRDTTEFKKQSLSRPKDHSSAPILQVTSQRRQDQNGLKQITSIAPIIANMNQLIERARTSVLDTLCAQVQQTLSSRLGWLYSREAWLKSELPKNVLMVDRMSPALRDLIAGTHKDDAMNSSCLNISVLDQSYCVGQEALKLEATIAEIISSVPVAQLRELWATYTRQFGDAGCTYEEENQLLTQVHERSMVKFTNSFYRDFQDYVAYIFVQKVPNSKLWPTHPSPAQSNCSALFNNSANVDLLYYIEPRFYNKIVKVYFQSLAVVLAHCLALGGLGACHRSTVAGVQQRANQILQLRGTQNYYLIQNGIVKYDDVVELSGSLDYWVEVIGQLRQLADQSQDDEAGGELLAFEEALARWRAQLIEDYLVNLHKFALVTDLKTSIERDELTPIVIPYSYMGLFDSVINWEQMPEQAGFLGVGSCYPAQQSFNYGSSVLTELDSSRAQPEGSQSSSRSSIFRIINKKLIIEGKGYYITSSMPLLFAYLSANLKCRTDFPECAATAQERICELIGFYFWYCKKVVLAPPTVQPHHSDKTATTPQNIGAATVAKGLSGIKSAVSLINDTYKEYAGQQTTQMKQHDSTTTARVKSDLIPASKRTVGSIATFLNTCDLLAKLVDLFNLSAKPKKVEKLLTDLQAVKNECSKELTMLPFLQIEQEISSIYESRLKTRTEVPTKETEAIIRILAHARKGLESHQSSAELKRTLEPAMKIVSKNYFAYLLNMESRGKAELKWFLPRVRQILGDVFPDEIALLDKQLRR